MIPSGLAIAGPTHRLGRSRRQSAPPAVRANLTGPFRHVPLPVPIGPNLDRKPPAENAGGFRLRTVVVVDGGSFTSRRTDGGRSEAPIHDLPSPYSPLGQLRLRVIHPLASRVPR